MTVLPLIVVPTLLLIIGLCYYVFKKNSLNASDREALRNMPLPIAPAEGHSITLSCMNIKGIYLFVAAVFWTITLVLSLLTVSYSKTIPFAPRLKGLLVHLTDIGALIYTPIIFVLIFLYLYYHRKAVVWQNGLLISLHPVEIEAFEIKRPYKSATYLYLRSKHKTWILAPITAEEMNRFINPRIMAEQVAVNDFEVEKLRQNLLSYGAREQKFRGIPMQLIIAGLAFLICLIAIAVIYLR